MLKSAAVSALRFAPSKTTAKRDSCPSRFELGSLVLICRNCDTEGMIPLRMRLDAGRRFRGTSSDQTSRSSR